jgi:hypothetical protein
MEAVTTGPVEPDHRTTFDRCRSFFSSFLNSWIEREQPILEIGKIS